MILHILTQGPDTSAFKQCLQAVGKDDGILLIQDGVYCTAQQHLHREPKIKIYALTEDRQARGLSHKVEALACVDYAGVVALTLEYDKTVTWS